MATLRTMPSRVQRPPPVPAERRAKRARIQSTARSQRRVRGSAIGRKGGSTERRRHRTPGFVSPRSRNLRRSGKARDKRASTSASARIRISHGQAPPFRDTILDEKPSRPVSEDGEERSTEWYRFSHHLRLVLG